MKANLIKIKYENISITYIPAYGWREAAYIISINPTTKNSSTNLDPINIIYLTKGSSLQALLCLQELHVRDHVSFSKPPCHLLLFIAFYAKKLVGWGHVLSMQCIILYNLYIVRMHVSHRIILLTIDDDDADT